MSVRNGATVRGTSNGNQRGSAEDRRRRRAWLVETYRADVTGIRITYADDKGPTILRGTSQMFVPDPETHASALDTFRRTQQVHGYIVGIEEVALCRCYMCGVPLTVETLTVDRIIPGCKGGTYRRDNIRPACGKHNSETGGALARSREHQAAKRRAALRKQTPLRAVR